MNPGENNKSFSSTDIGCICFDFYDVIHVDPFNKWLADLGISREGSIDEASRKYNRGMISHGEFLAELSNLSGESPHIIRENFIESRKFDEEVIELIRVLGEKYSIGLISNSGGPGIRQLLKSRDLESLFDEIIVSGEVGFIKPEREIFDLALNRLGAIPEDTIFVDDNPHNINAAIKYGINGIVFSSARQLKNDLNAFGIIV